MESLQNQKFSMAIFFMPKTCFKIFALIQGDNSVCQITKEEIQTLYKAFDFIAGNEVCSLPIQEDNFSGMEIL